MNRKGKDTIQKMVNPTICWVVVGTLAANVFGMLRKEGQIAAMQTLRPC